MNEQTDRRMSQRTDEQTDVRTNNANIELNWLNGVLRRFQQYFIQITATVNIVQAFPEFHKYKLGLWSVLPKDTPPPPPTHTGYNAARIKHPWITSPTLYRWATRDPTTQKSYLSGFGWGS